MAWENELTIIVRHIIDDLDPNNYQFSNDRIEEAITVAAQLIHNEMEFSIDYNIEVDNRIISPDPTVTPVGASSKDDDFIALCCLRTAILFTSSQLKTYSLRAAGQGDASVHAIMEQLTHSGSKQVIPMDMRSGWAYPGLINGSGLRAT